MTAPPNAGRARDALPEPVERARLRCTVGAILRRERLAQGWTQAVLAEHADLTDRSVKYIENGERRPSESATRRLAEALRPDGDPIAVAMLDVELRRAAGPSLRRWRRKAPRARRAREYAEAARRLDAAATPTRADRLALGRALAALTPPWAPPR